MKPKRIIQNDDILPLEVYGYNRLERRQSVIEYKKNRRLEVGPVAAFYFENYTTMLSQIQEMLWIEKGGEEQVADELAAYNPLIPQGYELVATLMFEIAEKGRREEMLSKMGSIEKTVTIEVAGQNITAVPEFEEGIDRTRPDGKTSSIHFLRFPFELDQIVTFREHGARIIVALDHPEYAHMAVMPEAMRKALAEDFN